MPTLKALDTLLRVKRRRVEQREQAVAEALQAVREQQAHLEQARAQEQACRDAESDCEQKIHRMCNSGFRANDLLALQMVLKGLNETTRGAMQATASAQQQLEASKQLVVEARKALQRAQTVVEFLEKQRVDLKRSIEDAAEDLQEEETEEASVARMLAAQREQAASASA